MVKCIEYSIIGAFYAANDNRHAQIVMKELGIKYTHATARSIVDDWVFWNATNIPDNLPKWIRVIELSPHEHVGYGLSKEDADRITTDSTKP